MSKYSLTKALCQKKRSKRSRYDVLSDTGRLLRGIIISNSYNRKLAGAIRGIEHKLKKSIVSQITNSCFCRTKLYVDENRRINVLYSCQFMGCMLCGAVKSFKETLRFFPYIQKKWQLSQEKKFAPNWWFLTLTVPTCQAEELPNRLKMMQKAWLYIQKKRHKEGVGAWDGLRKLEVNHSLKKELRGVRKGKKDDDYMYHAHYHFLVLSRTAASKIMKWWVAWWAKQGIKCSQQAQKLIQVGDSKNEAYDGKNKPVKALMELLKYVSKPIAPINQNKKGDFSGAAHIYNCLSKKRKIEGFGPIRNVRANKGLTEAWVKSLSDAEVEVLNLMFLRKKYADRDGITKSVGGALETGEAGRYVTEDKDHLIGKTFVYDIKHLKYVCRRTGESLTTVDDFDETNPLHISQKIRSEARRYKLFEDRIDIVSVLSHLVASSNHDLNDESVGKMKLLREVYGVSELAHQLMISNLSKKAKVTSSFKNGHQIKIERDAQGNDEFMQAILRGDKAKFDKCLPYADFHVGNQRKQTCAHLAAQQDDTYYIEQIIGRGWGQIAFKDMFLMMPSSYVSDFDIKKKVQNYEKREEQSKKVDVQYGKRSADYIKMLKGTIFKKVLEIPTQQAQKVRNAMQIESAKLVVDEDLPTLLPIITDKTQTNIGACFKKSDLDCLQVIIGSPRGQAIRYDHMTDRVYVPHINKWLDFCTEAERRTNKQ